MKAMKENIDLFVFRHGETDWNADKKFQGHTDIPLNEKGKLQAEDLFEKFKNLNPEVCLSSDLNRAIETAKISLKGFPISYLFSAQLRESFLGDVEGMNQQEIVQKYGQDILVQWRSIEPQYLAMSFPNGETKFEHLTRVQNFIKEFIFHNQNYQRIAISTHGGSVVRLVHSCLNAPKESITIPNCCLYHVQYSFVENNFIFKSQI